MSSKKPGKLKKQSPPKKLVLKLFIAGDSPNSSKAVANLDAILEEYAGGNGGYEKLDVLQSPESAMDAGVIVTPTLLKVSPPPVLKILGDLSDRTAVVIALGLGGCVK